MHLHFGKLGRLHGHISMQTAKIVHDGHNVSMYTAKIAEVQAYCEIFIATFLILWGAGGTRRLFKTNERDKCHTKIYVCFNRKIWTYHEIFEWFSHQDLQTIFSNTQKSYLKSCSGNRSKISWHWSTDPAKTNQKEKLGGGCIFCSSYFRGKYPWRANFRGKYPWTAS